MLIAQKAYVKNKNGEILALFRGALAPARPSTWDLPGGIIEEDEDPEKSIRREIAEETGLRIKNLKIETAKTYRDEKNNSWLFVLYSAEVNGDDAVTLSFEHDEYRWIKPEQRAQYDIMNQENNVLNNLPEFKKM